MPLIGLIHISMKELFSHLLLKVIVIFVWLYTGWLLLWNILRLWPGERFWGVAITNYFAPWLIMFTIPISILMFIFKRQILALTLIFASFIILLRFIPLYISRSRSATTVQSIKIMTYNLDKHNNDLHGIVSTIKEAQPDVVALQELVPLMADELLKELEDEYPYHTLSSDIPLAGQGLLSRYELVQNSAIPDYRYLSATVKFPKGKITIYNIHAPTLFPQSWKKDWMRQREFINEILLQASKIEGPLLILGDFNTTPLSENYNIIRQEYYDAFEHSGSGFGFTFPARDKFGIKIPLPLVRIDYIFHSNHLVSNETRVLINNGGSDHRPVVSLLSLLGGELK